MNSSITIDGNRYQVHKDTKLGDHLQGFCGQVYFINTADKMKEVSRLMEKKEESPY